MKKDLVFDAEDDVKCIDASMLYCVAIATSMSSAVVVLNWDPRSRNNIEMCSYLFKIYAASSITSTSPPRIQVIQVTAVSFNIRESTCNACTALQLMGSVVPGFKGSSDLATTL